MIVESAPAKLNLALHVRARRADGYHELETLFAFCADGDIVTVAPAASDAFAITGLFAAALDAGADNLVMRAAAMFRATTGIADRHAITLDKRLPVAAGIGGGSADAAATLRALALMHQMPPARLTGVAAMLGADVPACLAGRTMAGAGRGDDLRPVDGLPEMPALLVNPCVPVSTTTVFRGWDGRDRGALPAGETRAVALAGRNDLTAAARVVAPVIDDVLGLLAAQAGAWLVRMSGSGATCFALFDTAGERDRAGAAIAAARPDWWRLATVLT